MALPRLDEHGLLPVGIHDCTFTELRTTFGQNRWLDDTQSESRLAVLCPNRDRLCTRLADYLENLRVVGLLVEVLVDGSFVTDKPDPNDIDLIVVLPTGHDFSRDLPPREYNLLSKRQLRAAGYPFDVVVVANGDTTCREFVGLYQKVRGRDDLKKGLLRVRP